MRSITSFSVKEWAGLTAASRVAGVSVQTVINWTHLGRIRVIQTPIGRLYSREDLARLARRRRKSNQGMALSAG